MPSIFIQQDLKDRVEKKGKDTGISPQLVSRLALQLWVNGEWDASDVPDPNPMPARAMTYESDELMDAAFLMREKAGITIASAIRRGLRLWVDGEWEVGLMRVRNG